MVKRILMTLLLIILIIAAALLKGEESYVLNNGIPLSDEMIKIAVKLEIKNPKEIRTLDRGKIYGFDSIGGMTLNRAILIKKGISNRRETIAHELVHVRQYQDVGGIYKYLVKYLKQVKKYGYYDSPLEIEAREKSSILLEEIK